MVNYENSVPMQFNYSRFRRIWQLNWTDEGWLQPSEADRWGTWFCWHQLLASVTVKEHKQPSRYILYCEYLNGFKESRVHENQDDGSETDFI